MRKISEINEGLWDGIVRRGTTGDVKKEDDHRFRKALKALQDADDQFVLVRDKDFGDTFWAPFNFGSSYSNEPGYFMDADDLAELSEYLKETNSGYRLPDSGEWHTLLSSDFEITKAGKYWSLFKIQYQKQFYLPQFGYIPALSNSDEVCGLEKSEGLYYAFQYLTGFGFEYIRKMGGQPENVVRMFNKKSCEKVQVRLVKDI